MFGRLSKCICLTRLLRATAFLTAGICVLAGVQAPVRGVRDSRGPVVGPHQCTAHEAAAPPASGRAGCCAQDMSGGAQSNASAFAAGKAVCRQLPGAAAAGAASARVDSPRQSRSESPLIYLFWGGQARSWACWLAGGEVCGTRCVACLHIYSLYILWRFVSLRLQGFS